MIFRVHYRGACLPHVYCALYAAHGENLTGALCGTFTVRAGEEFEELKKAFAGAAFIDDRVVEEPQSAQLSDR